MMGCPSGLPHDTERSNILKKLLLVLAITLLTASLSASQLVVPAVGSIPGAQGSQWQSDVTIHNASITPTTITLEFHDADGLVTTEELTIFSRQTISIENVVEEAFGLSATSGALVITGDEFALRKLSVTSRTYNLSDEGEFGQDIPAWTSSSAVTVGDTAVLNGPADPAATRFNFGLYAPVDTEIDWILVREDGSSEVTISESYEAGTHEQYSQGISTFLEAENLANDVVYARVREGQAFVYGSIVENSTGDPSFVPSIATRENFAAQLRGVDLNEDGILDILDEDGDGILDGNVSVSTIGFPSFFRIVAVDPEGDEVQLQLVNPGNDIRLFDDGTVQWNPSSALRGSAGVLKVIASDGFAETEFMIPVLFR